jgi:hypothetical protein
LCYFEQIGKQNAKYSNGFSIQQMPVSCVFSFAYPANFDPLQERHHLAGGQTSHRARREDNAQGLGVFRRGELGRAGGGVA